MVEKNADYWIKELTNTEMPLLSAVVKQLSQLTGDDETEVNQLAEVILKDPHMTSQILKIANSIQYNPVSSSVNTVSRAIVLLGFQGVRSLCISIMVVDSLMRKAPRDRLLRTMAKAFHAAVLARSIYRQVSKHNHEEVFIAALLYHLGEMAFWAYGGQTADKLECADDDYKTIEKTLGTNFKTLSRELGKAWNLGDILQNALSDSASKTVEANAVLLGEAYSQININEKSQLLEMQKKLAAFTGASLSDTRLLVHEATQTAAVVAVEFGAAKVCHLITGDKEVTQNIVSQETTVMQADANLQLKVLRDLATAVSDNELDVTTIFQMALEGMHRGIGLERVVLAFFHQDRVRLKFVLGQHTQGWREKFNFDISSTSQNIFTHAMAKQDAIWLNKSYLQKHHDLFTEDIVELLGRRSSLMGVLRVNRRDAALFYADRGNTNEPLTHDHFEAFKHFLHQSEMSVQAMADKKRNG